MTLGKQNQDLHWVNHLMFANRVSGNLLSIDAPRQDLQTISNMTFLQSASDQLRQRCNYIALISRFLVEYFDALQPLKDACIQHMPHKLSTPKKCLRSLSIKVSSKLHVLMKMLVCLFFWFVCSFIFFKAVYIILYIFIIFQDY